MSSTPHPRDLYVYRSYATGSRGSVSAYLVERICHSTVVARIESLGAVPTSISEHELRLIVLRRRLVISGSWRGSASRRYAHARVRPVPVEESSRRRQPG